VTWQVVMPAADLWEGELTAVELGNQKIVLLNVGGQIRAFENRCPHLGFQLSEGELDGCTLTCANHRWEFEALTGKGTNPGNCQLTAFDIRVRDGQIEILAPVPR
jgi:toluene monooxygenase system ferredoxin subunit